MNFLNKCKRIGVIFLMTLVVAYVSFVMPSLAVEKVHKSEIEALIRAYILENPEILLEAQEALEKKRTARLQARTKQVLEEQSELVFSSKNQFEIGNPNGDIAVVEFFDYNCPFCKRAMADMDRLLQDDKKIRFVLKELPILGNDSVEAHRISTAVGRLAPDKYLEFHKKLLGGNGRKDGKRALQIAGKMGLDLKLILAMAKQEDINDAFREVNTLANNLGMNGTPSYVVGDEVVFGAVGYDALKEMIVNYRKCGTAKGC